MSRRRRKSPILARTLAISVGVNIVLLPVLAHFGAFKKLESSFHEATVVLVKPAEREEEKDKPKSKEEKKPEPKKAANAKGQAAKRTGSPLKANPNAPKVVTAEGAGPASGDGAAIQQGTGKAGEVPNANPGDGGGVKAPEAKPPEERPKPSEPKVEPRPKEPESKPAEPRHVPVYREPEVDYGPEPSIPDDLRNDALEATFIAEFEVGSDGIPVSVKTAKSTGNRELDRIAMDTAKKWRFKAASLDGKGVTSKVRLKMEFTVE